MSQGERASGPVGYILCDTWPPLLQLPSVSVCSGCTPSAPQRVAVNPSSMNGLERQSQNQLRGGLLISWDSG